MQSFVFPGNLDRTIAAIGSEPIPYMRTQEFSMINLESEQILLDLIHCKNGRTIIYTGSGTGAMSAIVENKHLSLMEGHSAIGGSHYVSIMELMLVIIKFPLPKTLITATWRKL